MAIDYPDAQLRFGNAVAYYPRGAMQNWAPGGELTRRPEQNGADVTSFGLEPRPFYLVAVLFAESLPEIASDYARWEAEVNQIHDLRRQTSAGAETCPGAVLHPVQILQPPQRISGASNGATWMQHIRLAFSRVAWSES